MAGINRSGTASTAPQGRAEGRNGTGWGLGRYKSASGSSWEPTTTFLVILVIAEIFAYGALRYTFRSAHGG